MKTSCCTFSVFFLLFSFSILLVSCSQESTITSPNESKVTAMGKAVVIPTVQFNHTTDTVITLPKSGKTLSLSKSYTANQLAQIDSFLTTHTIKTKTTGLTPLLQSCSDRTFTNWELENQYDTVSGKYLGIWSDKETPQQLHNQYGFTYYFATNGLSAGNDPNVTNYFPIGNLLVPVSYSVTLQDLQKAPTYNYYYVDEPFDNVSYTVMNQIASLIYQRNSAAKFLFSDYYYPETNLLCFPHEGNGDYIKQYYFTLSNVYIMCDQYNGNGCGNAHDFWNDFKAFYGIPNRNISNWISLNVSTDWGTLLNLATSWGMNPIWIYGQYSFINDGYFQNFAITAWETGWLLRQEKQLVTEWKCVQNNCTNCSYPTSGTWYLYDSWIHQHLNM